MTTLPLLDLTAALKFDRPTVDYEIFLERLRVTFGVNSFTLSWFQTACSQHTTVMSSVVYLKDRSLDLSYSSSVQLTDDCQARSGLHQYVDDSGSCPAAVTSTLSTDILLLSTDNIVSK